ncbi:MAG: hypothetical protein Q9161_005434 [Pseudevernia consocians]
MVLKFPSGSVSVSLRDLQSNRQSQSTCGICDKPWVIESHGCIKSQLHVLHPCQHLIGSGCWISVPDEQKHKCPKCKVEIRRDEKVRVHPAVQRFATASQDSDDDDDVSDGQDSDAERFALAKELEDSQAQDIIVENKMKDGLNDDDVRVIMYYMNLCARLNEVKGFLKTLLARTKTLTPTHRERLVLFLANTQKNIQDSKHRKIEVALSAFNISGGTNFTMNDLRKILWSAEAWIKGHFATILEENDTTNNDASSLRQLEKKLAAVEAELKGLRDRQSRESAQRLKGQIKLAIEEIKKNVEEEVLRVRANADKEVAKARKKALEDIEKLQSHGRVMK